MIRARNMLVPKPSVSSTGCKMEGFSENRYNRLALVVLSNMESVSYEGKNQPMERKKGVKNINAPVASYPSADTWSFPSPSSPHEQKQTCHLKERLDEMMTLKPCSPLRCLSHPCRPVRVSARV